MTDTNVSSLVLKKGSNRYIFDPSGNLDLSNYYTKSEADGKYALKSHTHAISEITNLQSTLNDKAASNHTHSNYATTTSLNEVRNIANSKASFNLNNRTSWNTINLFNGKTFSTNARLIIFIHGFSGQENKLLNLTINGVANAFQANAFSNQVYIGTILYSNNQVISGSVNFYFSCLTL